MLLGDRVLTMKERYKCIMGRGKEEPVRMDWNWSYQCELMISKICMWAYTWTHTHTHTHTHTGARMCTWIHFLGQQGLEAKIPQAKSTPSIQVLACNIKKEPWFLEEKVHSGEKYGRYKISLCQKIRKYSNNNGGMSHRSQLEGQFEQQNN